MKKLLLILVFGSIVALTIIYLTDSTYLWKAFKTTWLRGQTDVDINDFTVQDTRVVKAGKPQPWLLSPQYNKVPISSKVAQLHRDKKTTAFLIIKDGKILTEKYYGEGSKENMSGLWSISKTYTSLLILKAVEDGLIGSIDDPVVKYIPEWSGKKDSTLTLRHLASMSAGLFWEEWDHTPFSLIAKFNFYDDLDKLSMEKMYATGSPGKVQHYNSGGTQMLGIVLKRVLKGKTMSDYLSEKFWQPMGYEKDGLFILDSRQHGNEKAYGGLVSNARDMSRMGQLILNNGKWNGKTLLTPQEIKLLKTIPYNNKTYGYGLWQEMYKDVPFYYQAGVGGQFCITVPKYNLVITRLGHKATVKDKIEWVGPDVYTYVEEAIRISNASQRLDKQQQINVAKPQ